MTHNYDDIALVGDGVSRRSIAAVSTCRTFREVEEEYFRTHPEEIDSYLTLIFDEYAKDGDLAALLASLRVISRVKGITATAAESGMTRKGLQKALSEQGNPKFASVAAILQAMGYRLAPQPIHPASSH